MTDKTPFNYTFTPKELIYYLTIFSRRRNVLCAEAS